MAYNYEYPYTDPYRYNDDWLLRKMRDLIEEWAAMKKQFDDLNKAFNDLKNYVMNYFENLDVQQEVENVLNKWLADGTIQTLIDNYINLNFGRTIYGIGRNIVIGGNFSMSKTYENVNIGTQLLMSLGSVNPVSILNPNTSFMVNGELSFASKFSDFIAGRNLYQLGFRRVFVFFEPSDLTYTSRQLQENMKSFSALAPGLSYFAVYPIIDPINGTKAQLLNFLKMANMRNSGFYIPQICPTPYLMGDDQNPNTSFYTDTTFTVMRPNGCTCFIELYAKALLYSLYRSLYSAKIYDPDADHIISIRSLDYTERCLFITLNITWMRKRDSFYTAELPTYIGNFLLNIPDNGGGHLLISNIDGTLTVDDSRQLASCTYTGVHTIKFAA